MTFVTIRFYVKISYCVYVSTIIINAKNNYFEMADNSNNKVNKSILLVYKSAWYAIITIIFDIF